MVPLSEDFGKDEKIDLTPEAKSVTSFSLGDARVMAIRHARANTEIYGVEFQDVSLFWEPVSEEEEEKFYDIKLSFRPAGSFTGTPGLEQFVIAKTGEIELRQVLESPGSTSPSGGGIPRSLLLGGLSAAVITLIAVITVFATGGSLDGMASGDVGRVRETAPMTSNIGKVPESGSLSLETDSGSIKTFVPQGAAPVGSVLSVEPIVLESLPSLPAGLSPTKHAFDVSLVSLTGDKTNLSGEVTVSVVFGDAVVKSSGKDSDRLVIGHFEDDAGEWEQLTTLVEWETKTAWARVDNLSPFALLVRDPVETVAPTKDPFGNQTGATIEEPTAVLTPTPSPVPTATAVPTPTSVPAPTPGPYARADAYRQAENWSMAIREYKTVIEADPSDRDAHFFRAYSYHEIGDHWPAITGYDKVLELSPSAVAYNNRGDVYKDVGRYEQAIDDYTEAIKLDMELMVG